MIPEKMNDTGERMMPTRADEVSVVFSRHKFTYEYIQQYTGNRTVIDVGCGTGYGSRILSENAREVIGIDLNNEAIAYCRENYKSENLSFVQSDVFSLNEERKYDIAVTLQVIEHVDNVSEFCDKLKSIVKEGGGVFISTPNIPVDQKIRNKNSYHVNEMTYPEFKKILENKFKNVTISGIAYANENWLRRCVGRLPMYTYLGRKLKRNSRIKKIASHAMEMTKYKVIHSDISSKAADLLAFCENR
jgi:2-polyprenyl-3-methyl-5-hydroxy-6-metoxy-1,4-benzoquinol methylase